jgi:hypothetical protein
MRLIRSINYIDGIGTGDLSRGSSYGNGTDSAESFRFSFGQLVSSPSGGEHSYASRKLATESVKDICRLALEPAGRLRRPVGYLSTPRKRHHFLILECV